MNINKKNPIVFVTNNYFPYSGGVVNSIEVLRQELEKQGYSVFIITLDFLGKKHQDTAQVIRINCPIKFMYKKNHMAIPWRATSEIAKHIQKLQPSIIHVHHPFLLGNSAINVARKKGIPIVFTYHTQYDKYLHYVPLPKNMVNFFLQKRLAAFCSQVDGIIAPSQSIKNLLKNYGNKITVIPSSISSLFFQPQQQKRRSAKFQLLTVSRFVKEKNIPFLLDVFAMLPRDNYSFILAGFGAELVALKEYAYNRLRLCPESVKFIERPSKQDLVSLYQEADLFIFASQSETQGLVIAEAMASGTPVIALHGPGQSDVIINNVNGFLVETNEEMRDKVEYCFANKTEHELLCQNASQIAQDYKPEIMAHTMINFYNSLIEKYN